MIPDAARDFFKNPAGAVDTSSKLESNQLAGQRHRCTQAVGRPNAYRTGEGRPSMALDLLTWACLMLAAGSPPGMDDTFHTNLRGFTIPVTIEPARLSEVKEVILYLSRDQGRSWELYSRTTPDKKGFNFLSNLDGLFYFSIQVIDKRGRIDPPDIYKAKVGQKILIDTAKPLVKITTAERTGEEILVAWEIQEDHPDWPTWRLEYRPAESNGPWTPLMLNAPSERGNMRFKPGVPGPVTVRLSLRDLATNVGSDEKVISGGSFEHGGVMTASAVAPIGGEGSTPPPPPPPSEGSPPGGSGGNEPAPARLAASTPVGAGPVSGSPPPASDMNSTMPMRGSLPALQIVAKKEVKLGFNVGRFGPSGLGKVDVYVTTDEGATWQKSSEEPRVSFPPVSMDRSSPVRGTVTVSVPKDGAIYGYYLVVKSRAGLGKPAPRPGDPPHVRVEMDTTAPYAELRAPSPAPGQQDSLIMSWKAEDRNLAGNPISLEWSPNANGPWTFIGDAQLPNTGRYVWHITEKVPPAVYLKLTVRDLAGNIAVAQTDKPVLIDLTAPEVDPGSVGVEK
jgi:hypothetical protein